MIQLTYNPLFHVKVCFLLLDNILNLTKCVPVSVILFYPPLLRKSLPGTLSCNSCTGAAIYIFHVHLSIFIAVHFIQITGSISFPTKDMIHLWHLFPSRCDYFVIVISLRRVAREQFHYSAPPLRLPLVLNVPLGWWRLPPAFTCALLWGRPPWRCRQP